MNHADHARLVSTLNIIVGAWLVVSPFVFDYSDNPTALWNNVIVGTVIALFALLRTSMPERSEWMSWANLIMGLWIIVSPYVLPGYTTDIAQWNNLVFGALSAILGWRHVVEAHLMRTRA